MNLPRHLAIIMDGNGRWAQSRGLPRAAGHKAGVDAVKRTVRACGELGIPALTLYAFSTENWLRPRAEVDELMRLLCWALRSEVLELKNENVRLRVIGRMEGLPEDVQEELDRSVDALNENTGLLLTLALNYGGRAEIIDAAAALLADVAAGRIARDQLSETVFSRYLATGDLPDPDLLIRTSGEFRLSNFLLWQAAYAEFYFTKTLWPDFHRRELLLALVDYQRRERRFGRVEQAQQAQSPPAKAG